MRCGWVAQLAERGFDGVDGVRAIELGRFLFAVTGGQIVSP